MSDAKREIRTIRRPACFLCGSEGKVRYTNLVDRLFNAPGTWVLKECCGPACGLLWLDPTPLSEDLPLAYQKYFTHEPGKRASQSGRIRGLLYQGYQVASTVPATLTGLQKAKNHLRQMFLTDLKPGRLLDVGCGDGVFLDRMRKEGWAVDGVDFDEHAIENAKLKYGLKLWHGDLHSAHFQADSFDAITLSHVIEHVTNPGELMVELKRILKPGGRVVLTTPNSAGLGHRKFQSYWWGLGFTGLLNRLDLERFIPSAQPRMRIFLSVGAIPSGIRATSELTINRLRI